MEQSITTLDARGLICPIPTLKARKRLTELTPGAVLEVWADDPAARRDIPALCAAAGHSLAATHAETDGSTRFRIVAWAAPAAPADAEPEADSDAEPGPGAGESPA